MGHLEPPNVHKKTTLTNLHTRYDTIPISGFRVVQSVDANKDAK